MLILQESCTDVCDSYIIYAPVDIVAMNFVLNYGDPNYVALLPSGLAILPDGTQSSAMSLISGFPIFPVDCGFPDFSRFCANSKAI